MSVNRVSLCNQKRTWPIPWRNFIDQSHTSVKKFNTYLQSLSEFDRDELDGRIRALRELASFGSIPRTSRQFENISLYPELFELKWTHYGKHKGGTHLRQYHSEPEIEPRVLVALHIHLKDIHGTPKEIRANQDQEISYAKLRHEAGRKRNWVI